MAKFACPSASCDYVYDEKTGDPDFGLPATPWTEVGDHFCCPLCGLGKDDFKEG